ncbi:MAG: nucleotidyltransferase domain-containing protein [Cyanobacteria bacterium J06621_8]
MLKDKVQTKQEIFEIVKDNEEKFAAFGVFAVGLFGSFVREEATEESDVDLLVWINNNDWDNFCDLIEFAEGLFGRKTDVITEGGITPDNGQTICKEVEYVFDNVPRTI